GGAGSVEQGQRPLASQLEQLPQQLLLPGLIEFGAVAAAELVPSFGTVPEPPAELVGGSDLSQPEVRAQLLLLDPTWPEAVHQNDFARGRLPFVHPLDTDRMGHSHLFSSPNSAPCPVLPSRDQHRR